jgi:hypothetical protein
VSVKKPKYNPVRVKDPSSDSHIVRIWPTQGFELVTSSNLGHVEVEANSDLFRLKQTTFSEKQAVHCFEQNRDLNIWSEVSRTYLGDVTLIAEKIDRLVSLAVILEASDNKDMLTIINPTGPAVRLDPDTLLEVVLYGREGQERRWDYQFVPSSLGLKYELAEQTILMPQQMRVGHAQRRCFDHITETHLWFRYDWTSKMSLSTLTEGTYPSGRLRFAVQGGPSSLNREVNLLLQIKDKESKKKAKFSTKPIFPDMGSAKKTVVASPVRDSVMPTVKGIAKEFGLSSGDGWPPEENWRRTGTGNSGNKKWEYYQGVTGNYTKNKKEDKEKRRRDIRLQEKQKPTLESGCHVLTYENSKIVH